MTFTFRLSPSRRKALGLGFFGLFAAALAAVLLPPPYEIVAAVGLSGLSLLGASFMLDTMFRKDIERVLALIGEVKVRLAQTNMRLDSLAARLNLQPMSAADAAPTKAALAELTAEVGLLGGLLQNVAQTLTSHEERLSERCGEGEAAPAKSVIAKSAPDKPVAVKANTDKTSTDKSVSTSQLVAKSLHVVKAASAPPVAIEPASILRAEADESVQAIHIAVDEARAEEIAAAVANASIEIHLQPIVQLPQRRTVGYEAFVRLRLSETNLLLPAEFLHVVEERGLAPTLDALVLARVLVIARYLAARPGEQFVSCNISPMTWNNPRAVASIARLIENFRAFAPRLVLEIPQRIFRSLDPTSLGLLGAMSATGARFALDQLADLRLDPMGLSDRGVRFVKAPSGLLLAASEGRVAMEIDAADLAPLLARTGISLVAEKVENDRMAADLIDLNISYAQGLLFAPPRLARPEIFAEPAEWTPAQDTAPTPADISGAQAETAQAEPEQEERRSFRSVLRKASV